MKSTADLTALVTGARSGLGIEAAAQLAARRAQWNVASKAAASLPAAEKEEA